MKKITTIILILSLCVILSAQTAGTKKWTFDIGDDVTSLPAIGIDGTIYIGSWNNNLYAINPDSTLKWTFTTEGKISSSPIIGIDSTIYVGSRDKKLYAINPDGTQKWVWDSQDILGIEDTPAIGFDGTIYVTTNANKMYAINPDGTKKWERDHYNTSGTSPVIAADGTIYITNGYVGKLFAINPDNTIKWSYNVGNLIDSSCPAIANDGTIYLGSSTGFLAINPNGTKKWELEIGQVLSSPAIGSDGTIYVGAISNKLFAINPDGSKKWEYETSWSIYLSPTIGSNGNIYICAGASDPALYFLQNLYSFNPDGTIKWSFVGESDFNTGVAISNDGTLYLAGNDAGLYAINSDCDGLANSSWPTKGHDNYNSGRVSASTSIDKRDSFISEEFQLSNAYPNPFNPTTNIDFFISKNQNVEINIYNGIGQKVKTLTNQYFQSGNYSLQWNGKSETGESLPSGIYIYQMKSGVFFNSKKMIFMK